LRRHLAVLLVLLCRPAHVIAAQWHIGLAVAETRYRGSSQDTSNSHVASGGRPGDATALSVQIGRSWQRYGFALRASYAKPGLAVSGHDVTLTDKTSGDLLEIAPLLVTRVGGIGPSGAVKLEIGPALHLWNFEGDIRDRVGGLGAIAYEWPIAGRFLGSVTLEAALSSSWFDQSDLPPEFERQLTWRYGVGLGLRYRL